MNKKHGPWTITKSKEVYKTPWMSVTEDDIVAPDGQENIYTTVNLRNGVHVVPLEGEHIHLIKMWRYALGSESIEIVSGGLDQGETPEIAASRELEEEIGFTSNNLINLGKLYPNANRITTFDTLYVATDLKPSQQQLEDSETHDLLETFMIPFEQAVEWVLNGTIVSTLTAYAILRTHHYLQQNS